MKKMLTMITLAGIAAIAASSPAQAAGDPVAGKRVFMQCQACHKVDATGKSGIGPNLRNVAGRRAGSLPGFKYSPAMSNANRTWSDAELDAFLAAPAQRIPGSRMPFGGLKKPADRQDVIAYLKAASK